MCSLAHQNRSFAGANVDGDFFALMNPDNYRSTARVLSSALPDRGKIDRAFNVISAAIDQPTDETTIRLFLGVMLDGLRSKITEGSSTYIAAATFSLLDCDDDPDEETYDPSRVPSHFSPSVIAAAVRDVWLKETFPPPIHELVAMLRKRRIALGHALETLGQMQTMCCLIDVILSPPSDEECPF
jgi:hypothetical protein